MYAQIRNSACMFAENNASPDLRDTFYLASIKDMLKDTKEACKVQDFHEAASYHWNCKQPNLMCARFEWNLQFI